MGAGARSALPGQAGGPDLRRAFLFPAIAMDAVAGLSFLLFVCRCFARGFNEALRLLRIVGFGFRLFF
jgi:hypothetical protein